MSLPVEGNKTTTEVVDTVVFDKNFAFDNKRLLFKIDVEGHELKALEGMKATLAKIFAASMLRRKNIKFLSF